MRYVSFDDSSWLGVLPAGEIADVARGFESWIWIECNGVRAFAQNIRQVEAIRTLPRRSLSIVADGPDADAAAAAVANILFARARNAYLCDLGGELAYSDAISPAARVRWQHVSCVSRRSWNPPHP